jgi:sugar-specific transcriptional regulator TrmB
MYEKILAASGLSPKEASIYEVVLGLGQATASEIYKKTPFKRGLVYKILDQLAEKGLITRLNLPGKADIFKIEHPYKINEMLDSQAQKLKYYKKSIDELMPQLVSNYNLAFNKPGIRLYEGEEGLKKLLADTLTSKEIIYTFSDVEAVVKYMDKINQDYVKKREKLDIKKRIIFVDSPFARKYLKDYHVSVTDSRFVDYKLYPFSSLMQIYDGKVAYISLSDKGIISMLITDQNVYQMNKSLFEFIWSYAKTLDQLAPLSPELSNAQ